MTHLNVVPLVDEGLGNSTYLLDLGDGRALAAGWSTATGEMLQVGA